MSQSDMILILRLISGISWKRYYFWKVKLINFIIITRQRSCGKVMFSVMSVSHSAHRSSHTGFFLQLVISSDLCIIQRPPPPSAQTSLNAHNLDLTIQLAPPPRTCLNFFTTPTSVGIRLTKIPSCCKVCLRDSYLTLPFFYNSIFLTFTVFATILLVLGIIDRGGKRKKLLPW